MRTHGLNVDNMYTSSHLVDQNEWADTTESLLDLGRQNYKIISANGRELHKVSVLIEIVRILLIMGNKLAVVLCSAHEVIFDELN